MSFVSYERGVARPAGSARLQDHSTRAFVSGEQWRINEGAVVSDCRSLIVGSLLRSDVPVETFVSAR